MNHLEACHIIARWLRINGVTVYTEFTLPNATRADVLTRTAHDIISIYEVKTDFKQSHLSSALGKYRYYCDDLWLCSATQIAKDNPEMSTDTLNHPHHTAEIGIIEIVGRAPRVTRTAITRPLSRLQANKVIRLLDAAKPHDTS